MDYRRKVWVCAGIPVGAVAVGSLDVVLKHLFLPGLLLFSANDELEFAAFEAEQVFKWEDLGR